MCLGHVYIKFLSLYFNVFRKHLLNHTYIYNCCTRSRKSITLLLTLEGIPILPLPVQVHELGASTIIWQHLFQMASTRSGREYKGQASTSASQQRRAAERERRRQAEQERRQQEDQARRQQEEQARRQQEEQARRQQEARAQREREEEEDRLWASTREQAGQIWEQWQASDQEQRQAYQRSEQARRAAEPPQGQYPPSLLMPPPIDPSLYDTNTGRSRLAAIAQVQRDRRDWDRRDQDSYYGLSRAERARRIAEHDDRARDRLNERINRNGQSF